MLDSPFYTPEGNIVFLDRAEEETWQLTLGAETPAWLMDASAICALPGDRYLTSVWSEAQQGHQISVTNAEGQDLFQISTEVLIDDRAVIDCGG